MSRHHHGREAGGPHDPRHPHHHPHQDEHEMRWGGRPGGHLGGFFGGRFGGRARRGEARYLLLDALADGPKHGYEIIKTIEERSRGAYVPSPGTVYPTLQYLQDAGLIASDQDGERRVFQLTPEGRTAVSEHAAEVQTFWARLEQMPKASMSHKEARFLQEELQFLERTVWGGLREAFDHDDHERVRHVRELVEHCRNQVRRVIADDSKEQNHE